MVNRLMCDKVASTTRKMYEMGLINAYEGNVSAREGDIIFITPGGINKSKIGSDMILITDLEGNLLEPYEYKLTSEAKMHYAFYKKRSDIAGIVHNHSIYATAYAVARRPIDTKAVPEMVMLFGTIPVLSYGTPGTMEVVRDLDRYDNTTDVYLLANHGLVALGEDVDIALERALAVEKTAKMLIMARMLGGEVDIEDDKLKELADMRRAYLEDMGRI